MTNQPRQPEPTEIHPLSPVPNQLFAQLHGRLASPDLKLELALGRAILYKLTLDLSAARSPQAIARLSNALARQLETIRNLHQRTQHQQDADSLITGLIHDILTEMNAEIEIQL